MKLKKYKLQANFEKNGKIYTRSLNIRHSGNQIDAMKWFFDRNPDCKKIIMITKVEDR